MQESERHVDDPERLAEEAEAQIEKQAADIRAAKVPIETDLPASFRP